MLDSRMQLVKEIKEVDQPTIPIKKKEKKRVNTCFHPSQI